MPDQITAPRIALQKFCSTDESRAVIMRPWRDGEFTYASDGRIMVRVPSEPGDEVITDEKLKASAKLILAMFDPGAPELAWQALPTLPPATFSECERCNGDKVHECSCGHQHDCPSCEGAGQLPDDGHMDIGPTRLNLHYLRMIVDLPNLEIAIRAEQDPMPFRFDGGVGVLMPMRK